MLADNSQLWLAIFLSTFSSRIRLTKWSNSHYFGFQVDQRNNLSIRINSCYLENTVHWTAGKMTFWESGRSSSQVAKSITSSASFIIQQSYLKRLKLKLNIIVYIRRFDHHKSTLQPKIMLEFTYTLSHDKNTIKVYVI